MARASTATVQCDQCGIQFQPRRVNKTGAAYCGNACRQKAHRQRHGKAKDPEAKSNGPSVTLPPPKDWENDPSLWNRIIGMLDLTGEIKDRAAKAKRNRLVYVEVGVSGLRWQRDRLSRQVEELKHDLERKEADVQWERCRAERFWEGRAMLGNGEVDPGQVEFLKGMTDRQLRNWALVFIRMVEKGHDSPLINSVAWSQGNSPQMAEGAEETS